MRFAAPLSIALLGCGSLAAAQDITPVYPASIDGCMGFADAIEVGSRTAPEVRSARGRASAADARVEIERGTALPQLSGYARAADGDIGLVDGRTNTQAGLILSQRIFDFGQGRLRRQALEARARSDNFLLLGASTDLKVRVGQTFIDVLESRELLTAATTRHERISAVAGGVDRRLETGLITIATANSIRAELASASAQRIDREIALESAQIDLATLTGVPTSACHHPGQVEDDLQLADFSNDDVLQRIDQLPQVDAAQARVDAASADYRLATRTRRPTISVQGVVAYQYDSFTREWNDARRVGLEVTMPLYGGGSFRAEEERAQAAILEAQGELGALRRDVERNLRTSLTRSQALMDLAIARENEVMALRGEVDAIKRQFEAGIRSFQDYENAEAALALAEITRIEARYDALRERLFVAGLFGQLGGKDMLNDER